MKYKTVFYTEGEMELRDKIKSMVKEGWAVYNIWDNPSGKYNSNQKDIIITYVKSES